MPVEPISAAYPTRRLRADVAEPEPAVGLPAATAIWIAIAGAFALLYAGSLDLNEAEAHLGLSIAAGLGPFGQVFGGWDPSVWPAQVAAGRLWAWADGGRVLAGTVRWPAAIAGVLLGAFLSRRLTAALGPRAGVLAGLAWFGCLGLVDGPGGFAAMMITFLGSCLGLDPRALLSGLGTPPGVDLIAGLGVVAALDRIINRGTGWVAGLWAALAFLAGGWPPLVVIALATVVLGRRGSTLSWKLALPPLVAAVAWSAWALRASPAAWGAALTLPLTQRSAWLLAPEVALLSLPWGPLALLATRRSVRIGWADEGKSLVFGWLQVAGAAALAGTLIPGLAAAARLPALAGLAVAAAACADRAWAGELAPASRRLVLVVGLNVATLWAALIVPGGSYLAMAIAYYRPIALGLVVLGIATSLAALGGALTGRPRWALGAVLAVAVGLKVAHAGIYVPESNYRLSQGPWGRAIGQWVPPKWPIYTLHPWPVSLAFATGHPVRQIVDERLLSDLPGPRPQFVLLQPEEFEHWRPSAPKLIKVRTFQDEAGRPRVLARTEGEFAWYRLVKEASKE